MTFIYELDHFRDTPDLQKCQGFRKLSSDRHTDYREVTRDHFRSRDKDGGHTDGPAIPVNQMLHANLMALSFIEPELWTIEVYIAGIGIFDIFAPVILILTR